MPLTPAVHQPLVQILQSLLTLQTTGGGNSAKRFYSFLFRDLPDKREYADYYLIIKEPRSLHGILESLKKGIYSSPQGVAYDLFLVWNNAREYNEVGSMVFNDAVKLESYMEKLWKAKSPPLPTWNTLARPGTLPGSTAAPATPDVSQPKPAKRIKIKSSSVATPTPPPLPPAASTSSFKGKGKITIARPAAPPAAAPPAPTLTLKLGGGRSAPPEPSSSTSGTSGTRIVLSNPKADPPAPPAPAGRSGLAAVLNLPRLPVNPPPPAAVTPPLPALPSLPAAPVEEASASSVLEPAATEAMEVEEAAKPVEVIPPNNASEAATTPAPETSGPTNPLKRPREDDAAEQQNPSSIPAVSSPPSSAATGLPALPGTSSTTTTTAVAGGSGGPPVYLKPKKKSHKKGAAAQAQAEKAAVLAAGGVVIEEKEKGETGGGGGGANGGGSGGATGTGVEDKDDGWFGGDIVNLTTTFKVVVEKIKGYKDPSGRFLATFLLTLPDRATRADYYQAISNPVALDVIEKRIDEGVYTTTEEFDRDLLHLFEIAKVFIKPSLAGLYSDLMVLQRLYQELTKRVVNNNAPALASNASLTIKDLSSVAAGPARIQQKSNADGTLNAEGKGISNPRVTMKDKIFLDGINFKGDTLRVGDWIHLFNPDNPGKPIIAQIFKTFKRPDSAQRCISVCWYYRPEETTHQTTRQFYENEVFKTSNFVDHNVEDFVDRCFVMFFTRYVRGRPNRNIWNPSMNLYVVEHRYKDEVKSFKKIKNWNSCVPEEIRQNEYELIVNDDAVVVTLQRHKSPFITGVTGPGGIGEPMEKEEEDQAKYHALPTGEQATAAKLRALKESQESTQKVPMATSSMYNHQAGILPPPPMVQQMQRPMVPTGPLPPARPTAPSVQPIQSAVKAKTFDALPLSILSKFRSDPKGDVLWFAAPAIVPPAPKRPMHSEKYLQWKAAKASKGVVLNGGGGGDVDMTEV